MSKNSDFANKDSVSDVSLAKRGTLALQGFLSLLNACTIRSHFLTDVYRFVSTSPIISRLH